MRSIIILIDYFGKWPEWFHIYLESCRRNPSIKWLIHTDCPFHAYNIKNVEFRYISGEDYIRKVNEKLKVRFSHTGFYKLCDLKPMIGVLHEEEIKDYDFFGYGDIDVIYGNIRKFYTDEVLENNIISTHPWCVSGHLGLFRNKAWIRHAFRKLPEWKEILENPEVKRFDEDIFSRLFIYPFGIGSVHRFFYDLTNPFTVRYRWKVYFREQYTTPMTPGNWRNGDPEHPIVWFWKDGRVTNDRDGNLEYIYLHFMNFKSIRHLGQEPFWAGLQNIVHIKPQDIWKGIRIDRYGFHSM